MILTASSELVSKKVSDCFPDAVARQSSLDILSTYGTEPWQREHFRVQLALLKTYAADLHELHRYVEGAKTDYRDALISAEFYEQSQPLAWNRPESVMIPIRDRDRYDYERWLVLSLASRELVQQKVSFSFPDRAKADEAIRVLEEYGPEFWHREPQRTPTAIVWLSSGDMDTLRIRTEEAKTDFRRTLFLAECSEESKLPPGTSVEVIATTRRRDLDRYERWLVDRP